MGDRTGDGLGQLFLSGDGFLAEGAGDGSGEGDGDNQAGGTGTGGGDRHRDYISPVGFGSVT